MAKLVCQTVFARGAKQARAATAFGNCTPPNASEGRGSPFFDLLAAATVSNC